MRKQKILLVVLSFIAAMSFFFPSIVSSMQTARLSDYRKTVEIDAYATEIVQEININDTDNLSIVYEIITFGTRSLQNIAGYSDEMPAELFASVNEEIALLQNQYVLPETSFNLLDTPSLFRYDSQLNGSILVWEYYFYDDDENILQLLYHANTGKILSLDYENVLIKDNNNLVVDYYSPYIAEPNTFEYTHSGQLIPVYTTPQIILKTKLRLYDTGYAVTVHRKDLSENNQ